MPTSGLRPAAVRGLAYAVPLWSESPMPAPRAHIPEARSDVSTKAASPVRSRWRSAVEIAPAMNIAPIESPNAGTD